MPAVTLRLFASAREAAGTDRAELEVPDVAGALSWACAAYGEQFTAILETSRIWLNGEAVDDPAAALSPGDEIAVLPPVSGGA